MELFKLIVVAAAVGLLPSAFTNAGAAVPAASAGLVSNKMAVSQPDQIGNKIAASVPGWFGDRVAAARVPGWVG